MIKRVFFIAVIIYLSGCNVQRTGVVSGSKPTCEIPFEIINNFIIINLKVNGLSDCRFIYDTGSENSLFFERSIADLLHFKMVRKMKIYGSDLSRSISADIALGVNFEAGEHYFKGDILVLEDNIFDLDEYFGFPIYGIVGNHMFRNKQVEINYHKQSLFIYENRTQPPSKDYKEIDSKWEFGKPYVYPEIETQEGKSRATLKLLFDTGATLGLLIYDPVKSGLGYPAKIIPGNLGMGLGGPLQGYVGRFYALDLGAYQLHQVITHFHALDSVNILNDRSQKMGILGNSLLSKFNAYIDYKNEKIYLKANKSLQEPIQSDRSGLLVIATGTNYNRFIIKEVLSGSPGDKAGIIAGDQIIGIAGKRGIFLSLNQINKLLCNSKLSSLDLRIRRAEKVLRKKINLEDLI